MSVTSDIIATYRNPGAVVRRLVADGPREDRAVAILMAAAALIFLSRVPVARRAELLGQGDAAGMADGLLAANLFAIVFLLPLIAYSIAALSHLGLRALGGQGSFAGARIALFWALLATAPLMLVQGLAAGFLGSGPLLTGLGVVVFAVFLWFWASGLHATEFGARAT